MYRAQVLSLRPCAKPFGEWPSVSTTQEDMDGYIANYYRKNQLYLSSQKNEPVVLVSNVKVDVDGDVQMETSGSDATPSPSSHHEQRGSRQNQNFFLPELYPVGVPLSSTLIPPFHNELIEYFTFEDEPSNPIPVAPLPSLSEYTQSAFSLESPLTLQILDNIQEFRKIKDTYSKIVTKQYSESVAGTSGGANPTGEDVVLANPSTVVSFRDRNYIPTWKTKDLPPFLLSSESAPHLVQKSIALIASHAGFDLVSQHALTALTDILIDLLQNSAKTLVEFRNNVNEASLDGAVLVKTLQELGVDEPMELQLYMSRDVGRYGKKLFDLRSRLECAWIDYAVICFVLSVILFV